MSIQPPPTEFQSSKFFLIAEITAVSGKGDEMQKFLSAVSKKAKSDEEPGTLSYRVTRGVGSESDKFTVLEEYADQAALGAHGQSEELKAFLGSGTIADIKASYRGEVA